MSKFIAIDLDPQGIFAVAGTTRGGHANVEQAVAWDGTDGEPPSALTAESAMRIGQQLRERLKSAGMAQAPVLVTIARDRVILKELRYPAVPPADEPNVVRFQAMKELSDAPEDVVLDYVPLSNGAQEGERRSMAVAVRKDVFDAIQAMCSAANLKLAAVTPRPYGIAAGLARAFATGSVPSPENKTEAVAALTLGPAGGEFTVVRNGALPTSTEVTFTRAVPGPVIASETMLIAEVRRNLTMYAGANPGHPVQALYVAEAGGKWAGRLRSALGIPVHAYDPLAGAIPTIPESSRGRFASAVGLLEAMAADAVPINFVATRAPKIEKDPKQKQLLVAAAVSIFLLLGVAILGYYTLDAADQDLALLQQHKADLEADVARLEPDAKRVDAAHAWQARRVVWLDLLFDWSDEIPATSGVLATSINGKAILPDAKTGKQENQATIEIKVAAHGPEPVNAFMIALERDNTNPKRSYYVAIDKHIGPSLTDSTSKEYVVVAKVTNRPTDRFTRFPTFPPPSRRNYPPSVTPAKEPESATKDKEDPKKDPKEAPAPKEKKVTDDDP